VEDLVRVLGDDPQAYAPRPGQARDGDRPCH
jgi:hypothetical protein